MYYSSYKEALDISKTGSYVDSTESKYTLEDIKIVNMYQPDYIGFVFAKSHRQVTVNKAKPLRSLLIPKIQVVGVFVDAPIQL